MKKTELLGKTFSRLTVIAESPSVNQRAMWLCKCDCGNIKNIQGKRLLNGETTSCGCFKKELDRLRAKKNCKPKRSPIDFYLNRYWRSYLDSNDNLSYDEFVNLITQNCVYCGAEPFLGKRLIATNTLDRLDNSKAHNKNNLVTACYICNRAKLNNSLTIFYNQVLNFTIKEVYIPELLDLPENDELFGLNVAYNQYLAYDPLMTIDKQTFYSYIKEPCFYCNSAHNIRVNRRKFKSNGIDRLDNNKNHTLDNVVPCCFNCNSAKNNMTLGDFQDWMMRVKSHLESNLRCYNEVVDTGYYELENKG